MSKKCKECGHQMDDNVQACPNCGCPCTTEEEKSILNLKHDSEAEKNVMELADKVQKGGNTLAIFAVVLSFLYYFFSVRCELFSPATIIWLISTIIASKFILLMSNIIRAMMILFVNISITTRHFETNSNK